MLTLVILAVAFAGFSYYLTKRGDHITTPEAGVIAVLAAGVWTWFIAFRLDAGGIFAGGGAIAWSIVLAAVCTSIIRRATRAQQAVELVRTTDS